MRATFTPARPRRRDRQTFDAVAERALFIEDAGVPDLIAHGLITFA
jgi:hypothetical protein